MLSTRRFLRDRHREYLLSSHWVVVLPDGKELRDTSRSGYPTCFVYSWNRGNVLCCLTCIHHRIGHSAAGMVNTTKVPGLASSWKPSFGQEIYDGKIQDAKRAIEADKSVATKLDESGRNAVHWACSGGHAEFVEYLDGLGIPIDTPDANGWSPLMISVSAGKEELVKYLIQRGADVNQTNSTGQQPLHYAASKNRLATAELLIELGASVNSKDNSGSTPLHRAVSQGHTRICDLLIKNGARVNNPDNYGNTPLHVACEVGNSEIARLLAEHGASVEMKNKDERTPLDFCDKQLTQLLMRLAEG